VNENNTKTVCSDWEELNITPAGWAFLVTRLYLLIHNNTFAISIRNLSALHGIFFASRRLITSHLRYTFSCVEL
jgi:hypothetical protein